MFNRRFFWLSGASFLVAGLASCSRGSLLPDIMISDPAPKGDGRTPRNYARTTQRSKYDDVYAAYPGERFPITAFDYDQIDPVFLRQSVDFKRPEAPGSIVIDPSARQLFYVEAPGVATRYGVGVGREGFQWSGSANIQMKRDWPDWVPPREMVERQPEIREKLEPIAGRGLGVPGGSKSPLGARAMYLWADGHDLGYRIHGTTEPETIGSNVSSGCIRMINQDIAHLYARVSRSTPVTVLPV